MTFATVALIIVLALWQHKTFFYAIATPVALVYGFTTASDQEVYSSLWVAGVAIGLLGLFFLFQIASNAIKSKGGDNGK